MFRTPWFIAVASLGVALACSQPARDESPPPSAGVKIVDREWELVQLSDVTEPRGSQGRPVTLRFEASSGRAVGFAGCNQYGAAYRLTGDSLAFEPPIATRMACTEGMEVETTYLSALPRTVGFSASDSSLTLRMSDGTTARFRAR